MNDDDDDDDDDDDNDNYNGKDDDDEKAEERNQDANDTDNNEDVQIFFSSCNKSKFLNLTVWRIYIFFRTRVPLNLALTMERA